MPRFLVDVLATVIALWLVVQIVPGVDIFGGFWAFVWVALVFMFVNAFISPVVNFFSFPLKILTLGLFSLTGWISNGLGNGLHISGFWAAFFGAIVMALASWVVEGVFSAVRSKDKSDK